MAKKALPSPEVLRQLLRYEPETGKLYWLPRTPDLFSGSADKAKQACASWNKRHAGTEALNGKTQWGYLAGSVFNTRLQSHRVIWAIMHGEWPQGLIDHINNDRADNRACNLRMATFAENSRNVQIHRDNTSGFKGVYRTDRGNRWRAHIRVNRKRISLGTYGTPEEAHAAYVRAAMCLHGEFARAQ